MTRPVLRRMSGALPAVRSRSHSFAVRRSCQTMAFAMGLPVWRSHSSVVSRWLVMPMAAILAAVSLAFFSAALAVASWVFQMAPASCSTQPGLGKICGNSFYATAFTRPARSKTMARELGVPWSSARMYFIARVLCKRARRGRRRCTGRRRGSTRSSSLSRPCREWAAARGQCAGRGRVRG